MELFITVKYSPDHKNNLFDYYDVINDCQIVDLINNEIKQDKNVIITIKKCN